MKSIAVFLMLISFFLLAGAVLAQSGGPYDLSWNTVDGGGAAFSMGGGYTLAGTIGQPDAGLLSGGGYTLAGGFWNPVTSLAGRYRFHLPLVMKGF